MAISRSDRARKGIHRSARLGRPAPKDPRHVDAVYAVEATANYRAWYDAEAGSPGFVQAFKDAWAARKVWVP